MAIVIQLAQIYFRSTMRHHRFMSKTAHLLLKKKKKERTKKQLAKLIAAFGLLCGLLSSACGESSYLVLFTVGGRSTVAIILHTEKILKINRCPQDQARSLTKDPIEWAHQVSFSHLKSTTIFTKSTKPLCSSV